MKKYKIDIYFIIIFIIVSLSHFYWFFSIENITHGDWGFYYLDTMKEFIYPTIWITNGVGKYDISSSFWGFKIIYGFLSNININYNISERLLFLWPSTLISAFGMYFLSYNIIKNRLASLASAIIYSLNTYILLIFGGHLTVAVSYSLFPLIFYFFKKCLESSKIKYILITSLLISISFIYEPRISYIISLILILFFLFNLEFNKKIINQLKIIFILWLLVFFINFFWIISYLIQSKTLKSIFPDRPWISFMKMNNAILLSHPFWTGYKPTEFIPTTPKFYMILYPLLSFYSIFFFKKFKNNDKKIVLFLLFVSLIGIFLVKQENRPFGEIYTLLFQKFPGFNMFREASKFYILIAFSYSLLTSYTISELLKKKYNLYLICSIFLILLYIGKPAFTTELGHTYKPAQIPKEYLELKNFINKQPDFFRTYWYPQINRFGFYSNNHPTISHVNDLLQGNLKQYSPTANYFYYLPDEKIFNNLMDALSVKYIIIPYDFQNDTYRHYGYKKLYLENIRKYKSFKEIKNFENINLFENEEYMNHFYIIKDYYHPLNKTNYNFSKPISVFSFDDNKNYYYISQKNITKPFFEYNYIIDIKDANDTIRVAVPKMENEFTVSLCVFPRENDKGGDLVAKRYSLTHVDYGVIYNIDNNHIKFGGTLNNGTNIYFFENSKRKINNWYHVLVNYDNKSLNLYVDGILSYSYDCSGNISKSDAKISIGQMSGYDSWFNGIIRDIKIYNKSLNYKNILDLANECKNIKIIYDENNQNFAIVSREENINYYYIKDFDYSNNFSISAYIFPNKMNYGGDIISKRSGYLTEYSIIYNFNKDKIYFGAGIYNGTNIYFFENTPRDFNKWYLVTVTYDGESLKLYVNGTLSKQVRVEGDIKKLNAPIIIGKSVLGNTYFNGTIKEIKFYNESIDYYQIKSESDSNFLYNKSFIENFDLVEKINVNYTFKNPTLYKIQVNFTEPFMLSFAESYDPGWEARVYKDGKKVETVKSIPLYGVINGFWINTTGENLEIVIRYKPQDYFELGLAISGITFFSCIGYLIYDWKRDFFNDKFYQLKARIKKQKYTYKPKK